MPFKSQAQAHWMFANDPEMAQEWAHETPNIKELPKRVTKTHNKKLKRKAALHALAPKGDY